MSQEQWIVYAYSVWPNGGWTSVWGALVIIGLFFSAMLLTIIHLDTIGRDVSKKLIKASWLCTLFTVIMLQIPFFIPDKKDMAAIIATPYIVEGGKSLVESLKDPNLKSYKINLLIDKSLDKTVEEITKASK